MYKQILVNMCVSATVANYLINAGIMDHIKSLSERWNGPKMYHKKYTCIWQPSHSLTSISTCGVVYQDQPNTLRHSYYTIPK